MSEMYLFIAFGLFALVLLAVLFRSRLGGRADAGASAETRGLTPENLVPRHTKYFSVVREALSGSDLNELESRISPATRRRLRVERRTVARGYLRGLREDFLRLERFGRIVAAYSPKVDARQEAERFRLGLRFRVVYVAVSLRVALGFVPVPAFERLTQLVGSLSSRIEASMTSLVEPGPTQAGAG